MRSNSFFITTDGTHHTTADWNQEYFLCDFAKKKTVWQLGRSIASRRSKMFEIVCRLPCCRVAWLTAYFWKLTTNGQNDKYGLRGVIWAENNLMINDNGEMCIVNEIIEELLELDMDPRPGDGGIPRREKLHEKGCPKTLLSSCLCVLVHKSDSSLKGFKSVERTIFQDMESLCLYERIFRSRTVPMTTKCRRVHSHVNSTPFNDSIEWPWSCAMINKVRASEMRI